MIPSSTEFPTPFRPTLLLNSQDRGNKSRSNHYSNQNMLEANDGQHSSAGNANSLPNKENASDSASQVKNINSISIIVFIMVVLIINNVK